MEREGGREIRAQCYDYFSVQDKESEHSGYTISSNSRQEQLQLGGHKTSHQYTDRH